MKKGLGCGCLTLILLLLIGGYLIKSLSQDGVELIDESKFNMGKIEQFVDDMDQDITNGTKQE